MSLSSPYNFAWLDTLMKWACLCTGKDALENRRILLDGLADLYLHLGARVEILEKNSSAPLLLATFNPKASKRVLLFGHIDTVFETRHSFQNVWIEGDSLRGPGVCDMKSGVLIIYEALKKLSLNPLPPDFGWSVVLNSDEEIGSPISSKLWPKLSLFHFCALGFEPSITTSSSPRNLAISRMSSTNLKLIFKGKSAHAGRNPEEGASAIHAACRFYSNLEEHLKEIKTLRVNVGKIQGGEASNIVADLATLDLNIRAQDEASLDLFYSAIAKESAKLTPPLKLEIETLSHRPPKASNEKTSALARRLCDIAKRKNLSFGFVETAGVCDGNNIGHEGVATIDNLGAIGGGLHSDLEWVSLSSIEEQIELTFEILMDLAQHPVL